MAKKQPAKAETKSGFLRRVLGRNPDLDYRQVNRRWAKSGHAGEISNALYYKVRAELGIRTGWVWVKQTGPDDHETAGEATRWQEGPNADPVAAAHDQEANILKLYRLFEDKRPVMVFDLQDQTIAAYPYEEFKGDLNRRSQAILNTQYQKAITEDRIVVFVRDNGTRRLVSILIDNE